MNCLVIEPILQTLAGLIGVAVSMSARPKPLEKITAPFLRTQIPTPGVTLSATIFAAWASTSAQRPG